MVPKVEMVPKECGFNQSETACGLWAGIAWRFPCSPTTARDGELIQMRTAFLSSRRHIVRHPNSNYVTTKLYGASTCGSNNIAIFSERTIFTFPTVAVCRGCWAGSGEALMIHTKVEIWQPGWIHYFLCSRLPPCLSTRSNIMIIL